MGWNLGVRIGMPLHEFGGFEVRASNGQVPFNPYRGAMCESLMRQNCEPRLGPGYGAGYGGNSYADSVIRAADLQREANRAQGDVYRQTILGGGYGGGYGGGGYRGGYNAPDCYGQRSTSLDFNLGVHNMRSDVNGRLSMANPAYGIERGPAYGAERGPAGASPARMSA